MVSLPRVELSSIYKLRAITAPASSATRRGREVPQVAYVAVDQCRSCGSSGTCTQNSRIEAHHHATSCGTCTVNDQPAQAPGYRTHAATICDAPPSQIISTPDSRRRRCRWRPRTGACRGDARPREFTQDATPGAPSYRRPGRPDALRRLIASLDKPPSNAHDGSSPIPNRRPDGRPVAAVGGHHFATVQAAWARCKGEGVAVRRGAVWLLHLPHDGAVSRSAGGRAPR